MTDKRTLGIASGFLDRALVLGHDHLVQTVHIQDGMANFPDARLGAEGTLTNWTAESAMSYAVFRQEKGVA